MRPKVEQTGSLSVKTTRLTLIDVTSEHAADFQRVMADPDMGKHTNVPCQPSEKRAAGFVNWMMRLNESGRGRAWAIVYRQEVIGFVRLNTIDKRNASAMLGYELSKVHWGQGLATETVKEVVRFCHDKLQLHRLEAWVYDGNEASAKVLEKAGFFREGILRSKAIHLNQRRDEWIYGRLISDDYE